MKEQKVAGWQSTVTVNFKALHSVAQDKLQQALNNHYRWGQKTEENAEVQMLYPTQLPTKMTKNIWMWKNYLSKSYSEQQSTVFAEINIYFVSERQDSKIQIISPVIKLYKILS